MADGNYELLERMRRSRKKSLPKGYATAAVRIIDKLLERRKAKGGGP